METGQNSKLTKFVWRFEAAPWFVSTCAFQEEFSPPSHINRNNRDDWYTSKMISCFNVSISHQISVFVSPIMIQVFDTKLCAEFLIGSHESKSPKVTAKGSANRDGEGGESDTNWKLSNAAQDQHLWPLQWSFCFATKQQNFTKSRGTSHFSWKISLYKRGSHLDDLFKPGMYAALHLTALFAKCRFLLPLSFLGVSTEQCLQEENDGVSNFDPREQIWIPN